MTWEGAVNPCSPEGPRGRLYGGVAGGMFRWRPRVKALLRREGGWPAGRAVGLVRIEVWT